MHLFYRKDEPMLPLMTCQHNMLARRCSFVAVPLAVSLFFFSFQTELDRLVGLGKVSVRRLVILRN
jgi:hypothetical protein